MAQEADRKPSGPKSAGAKHTKTHKALKSATAAIVLAAAWYLSGTDAGFRVHALSDPRMEAAPAAIHFIDVGQGSASLIRCGDAFALIDTGTDSSKEELVSYLETAGVDSLDLVVLTHLHDDHTGGFAEVLRAFDVQFVWLPDESKSDEEPESGSAAALEALNQSGVPSRTAHEGLTAELGEGVITVLSTGVSGADRNDSCTVARFDGGGISCLFGADAQEAELNALLDARADVSAQLYAVAHHGSGSGAIPELLRKIRAQYAVVSCGVDNLFGHPHEDTIYYLEKAGAHVLRTDQNGSVAAYADDEGTIQVVAQREDAA